MKKTFWGSLVASLLMSASLFAADCARVNTPLADGDILYAANYEGELNNLITCVNERVETIGDTLTGNLTFNGGGLRIWSGNNFNIYSDTGVTSTFSVSGSSGNIVSSGTLVVSGNSTFDTNTLFVDATNNRVGILTTSPADKLHIVATSDAEEVSRITASGTGASLTTQIYNSDSSKRFLNRYDFGTDLYTLQSDSGVILAMNRNGDVGIRSTKKFSYDSSSLSGNTYQTESSSDVFDTVVGGANAMRITTSDVKILNGLDLNIYSDSGSSLKFSVDSATGNAGIPLGQKLYFDGAGLSGNSWITSNSFFMTFNHQISGSQGFAFNGLISGTPTTLFQVSGVGAVTNAYFATSLATSGSAANLYMDSGTGQIFRSTSSIKYKKNVSDLEIDTSKIFNLRPVSFDNKKESENDGKIINGKIFHKKRYFGLIAEEVDRIIPSLVDHNSKTGEAEGVFYDRLSVLLLSEIKKLKIANDELKARLDSAHIQ